MSAKRNYAPFDSALEGENTTREKAKITAALAAICACAVLYLPGRAETARPSLTFQFETANGYKKARVISLPKDFSLGEIAVSSDPNFFSGNTSKHPAQGKTVVPARQFSSFIPGQRFYVNPSIINTLPSDAFDDLSLSASSAEESEDAMCDRALITVGHLRGLISLNLDRSDATDKGARHAADLPNLQRFSSFSAGLDGSCFKDFAGLQHLRFIAVQSNPIKDENLKYLGDLPQLKYLDLSQTNISDRGIKGLAKCTGLVQLIISSNHKISDESIDTLLSLKNLRYLKLQGTSISTTGLLRLKSLPLEYLILPGNNYSPSALKQLHEALPHAQFEAAAKSHAKAVDEETRTIYAPLH